MGLARLGDNFRRLALAFSAALALCAAVAPGVSHAQSALFNQIDDLPDAVGVGVWYGWGVLTLDAPAQTASNEVKGYTNMLPRSISGTGPSVGLSFADWGINVGYTNFYENLGGVTADVNQTPGNATDDPTVQALHGTSLTVNFLYQPTRWLYLGYGQERGSLEFVQVSALGAPETRRLPFDGSFYTLGLGIGFDPARKKVAPIVAAFVRIPAERGDFSGVTLGYGFGLFF